MTAKYGPRKIFLGALSKVQNQNHSRVQAKKVVKTHTAASSDFLARRCSVVVMTTPLGCRVTEPSMGAHSVSLQ